jgi:hypothetical protein
MHNQRKEYKIRPTIAYDSDTDCRRSAVYFSVIDHVFKTIASEVSRVRCIG